MKRLFLLLSQLFLPLNTYGSFPFITKDKDYYSTTADNYSFKRPELPDGALENLRILILNQFQRLHTPELKTALETALYCLTEKDVVASKVPWEYRKAGLSYAEAIMDAFPELHLARWRFQDHHTGFWDDLFNRLNFLQYVAFKKGWQHEESFYELTVRDIENYGGKYLLRNYYGDSLLNMLQELVPDFTFAPWNFSAGANKKMWSDKKVRAAYLEHLAQIYGWTKKEDFHQLNPKLVHPLESGVDFFGFYKNSPLRVMQDLKPNEKWFPWDFGNLQNKYWKDSGNLRSFLDEISSQMNWNNPEDFYNLSWQRLDKFGGANLNKIYHSMWELVQTAYPENNWIPFLFKAGAPIGYWDQEDAPQKLAEYLKDKFQWVSAEDCRETIDLTLLIDHNAVPLLKKQFADSIQSLRNHLCLKILNWSIQSPGFDNINNLGQVSFSTGVHPEQPTTSTAVELEGDTVALPTETQSEFFHIPVNKELDQQPLNPEEMEAHIQSKISSYRQKFTESLAQGQSDDLHQKKLNSETPEPEQKLTTQTSSSYPDSQSPVTESDTQGPLKETKETKRNQRAQRPGTNYNVLDDDKTLQLQGLYTQSQVPMDTDPTPQSSHFAKTEKTESKGKGTPTLRELLKSAPVSSDVHLDSNPRKVKNQSVTNASQSGRSQKEKLNFMTYEPKVGRLDTKLDLRKKHNNPLIAEFIKRLAQREGWKEREDYYALTWEKIGGALDDVIWDYPSLADVMRAADPDHQWEYWDFDEEFSYRFWNKETKKDFAQFLKTTYNWTYKAQCDFGLTEDILRRHGSYDSLILNYRNNIYDLKRDICSLIEF